MSGFPVKRNAYDDRPRWDYASAMDRAYAAVAHLPEKPKMDEELLKLRQEYNLVFATVQACRLGEDAAFKARCAAEKVEKELRTRIELREIELGMRPMSESDSVEEPWEGA